MQNLPKNKFFDINKFPKDWGIIVFPISISRTHNKTGQATEECLDYIKYFSPSKVSTPKIGLNMVYGDFLYFHSKEPASILKEKFMNVVLNHKNSFQKLLNKEWNRFQIQHAFSYEVWNQFYLDYKDGDFSNDFLKFKKFYKTDKEFQKYVENDTKYYDRELTPEQENFFLEEYFMLYLLSKGRVTLPNEYIQGREKWILWCYPGVPLKGQIYVYQKNPFKLEFPENPYQNCFYDLESKKLIDFTRIDLDTYNYKYE